MSANFPVFLFCGDDDNDTQHEEKSLAVGETTTVTLPDGREVTVLIKDVKAAETAPPPLVKDQQERGFFYAAIIFFICLVICLFCFLFDSL
jgi:hypothetical protein